MSVLKAAIEHFENDPGANGISEERKTFLDQVYVNQDTAGLAAVRTIGRQENEGVVLAGIDNYGVYTAILLSFVKKDGVHALQVITMSAEFMPDENLAFGITFDNNEKILLSFVHPVVPVEGTDYFANFIPLTEKNMADFINHNIIHWQFLNKASNEVLTGDFEAAADAILPQKEAQYLLRRIAYAVAVF